MGAQGQTIPQDVHMGIVTLLCAGNVEPQYPRTPVTRVEGRCVRGEATSTATGVQFSRIMTQVQQVVVRHM